MLSIVARVLVRQCVAEQLLCCVVLGAALLVRDSRSASGGLAHGWRLLPSHALRGTRGGLHCLCFVVGVWEVWFYLLRCRVRESVCESDATRWRERHESQQECMRETERVRETE